LLFNLIVALQLFNCKNICICYCSLELHQGANSLVVIDAFTISDKNHLRVSEYGELKVDEIKSKKIYCDFVAATTGPKLLRLPVTT
jgi:flagellar assembly factor FliW